MKRYLKYVGIAVLSLGLFVGCTQQERAKHFGGTATVEIPADRKMINVTWKSSGKDGGSNLWILTRDRKPSDIKETYHFTESSSWGVLQGTVVIVEK